MGLENNKSIEAFESLYKKVKWGWDEKVQQWRKDKGRIVWTSRSSEWQACLRPCLDFKKYKQRGKHKVTIVGVENRIFKKTW